MSDGVIAERRAYSEGRLQEIRKEVEALESLRDAGSICIYTTGSYGRLEASPHSDLDLFFVVGSESELPSRLGEIVLDADLIRLTRGLGFPEFSGEGEYLEVHNLALMERHLGGREDDYRNFFTARLLLLLESRPIANPSVYSQSVERVVDWYFRDFEDHTADFRPVFLANDIMRFWKTLCLNYENKRNVQAESDDVRARHRLNNLKLKFSRMLTCYSTLIAVGARPTVSPGALASLVELTPWERLAGAATASKEAQALLDSLQAKYEWFLRFTANPKAEQLAELAQKDQRIAAFERASDFGADMYALLRNCISADIQRYIMV
jgi:hypothetical protein